jgi:hypothetical protein
MAMPLANAEIAAKLGRMAALLSENGANRSKIPLIERPGMRCATIRSKSAG